MAARNSRETSVTVTRGKYDGVLSILQYNWHFYAASLCALVGIGALLWFRLLPRAGEALLIGAATLTAFWSLSSLLVSYYVYDYRGVTRWKWIPRILSFPPQQWLNIHAGLDESTLILTQFFPNTRYMVVDIYDPQEMTEPSIARARRLRSSLEPTVAGKLDALPLPDRNRDTLFLLFAAHEIRQSSRRTEFFLESARVLANSGQLLLVEHLRDWRNFVAFGPGFLHFHSRDEWLRLAHDAGLTVEREDRITPFVRYFLMTKAGA
jgi:ubiquinone/menaquinone biosynthesis C-methylase UbiE